MSDTDIVNCIVIDNGSGTCKVGFAGEDMPRNKFPSVVGRPTRRDVMVGVNVRDCYVGEEAQAKRGILSVTYPIVRGVVQNWDDMEKIWHNAFYNELRVEAEEHPVVISEAPMNPKENREKMAEIMFESFRVPAMYVACSAVLSIYASGRTSGLVVSSGDGVTDVFPIYDGFSLHHAIKRLDYSGSTLTNYLAKLLTERGHAYTTSAEREMVREVKEQMCYVSEDYSADMNKFKSNPDDFEKIIEMPNGEIISIASEMFRCPELIFHPELVGLESPGLHEACVNAIKKSGVDIRRELASNIVLSGGTTLLPNFGSRLTKEIKPLVPPSMDVRIVAPEERQYTVWIGGSILASLQTFQQMLVLKEDYDEIGSSVINKCV